MKKKKHVQKTIDDDFESLPEDLETGSPFDPIERDDDLNSQEMEDNEPETTDEITEGDFNRFKDSLPSGNDWEE